MRRVPWRLGLLVLTASVALAVVPASIVGVLEFGQFVQNADMASYLRFLWRSLLIALWGFVAIVALVTFFALGRRKALVNVRGELAGKSRLVTVLTGLFAAFVAAPAATCIFALGFGQIVDHREAVSPPGKVRVQNDLGKTVSVTFCPTQDCGGRRPLVLHDGDHVDYPKSRGGDVPDSVVVEGRDRVLGCGLLDEDGIPMRLAEEIDKSDCGADVDSMEAQ